MSTLQIAGVQHRIQWESPADTFAAITPMIAGAAAGGAEFVALAEMFGSGFSMNTDAVAEPLEGPSLSFLVQQSATHDIWTCGSVPTNDPAFDRPVNRLHVVSPDGPQAHYDKIHPFSLGGEDKHYSAGTGFLKIEINGIRVSFFVCYDLRFADSFWDLALDTDLYVVVANWPAKRRLHWQTLLRARAIENLSYVLGVNRVGDDGNGFGHAGDSVLHSPLGETLASAAEIQTVITGTVDPSVVSQVRQRFGFLNDR